jgi:hypothetical protein
MMSPSPLSASRDAITSPAEPTLLWLLKGSAHLGAVALYLVFFTSPYGLYASLAAALCGLVVARVWGGALSARGLALAVALTLGAGWGLSAGVEGWAWVSRLLSPGRALMVSDALFLVVMTFGLVGGLRAWGARARAGALVESGVVLLSAVQLFASHRNGQLHEPRFFADWVLISGNKDIDWWLQLFGAGVAAVSLLMLVRVRRTLHLLWATLAAALLLGALFWWVDVKKPRAVVEPISFAASGQGGAEGGEGKGEGEGGGGGGGGGGGSSSSQPPPRPPVPVAVAVFHDDYTPENGVLYFRQQALSFFDGVKLVADPSGRFDDDVLTELPNDAALLAGPAQSEQAHVQVSTSMFLIDEHPTPPALTHGVELSPLPNPDTARFVAAYGVRSLVPSVPITRHVGRRSVPRAWEAERREYYLKTHSDDPRYTALASEITRELPSHHAADPLRRALAVKRYLEREGYYTLKVKHRSSQDPVAPFLFGDMRGYCVHFAHSAVHLLRSQGVAARVALGYAVDARTRSTSSAVVITGDRAHAWPEIHLDGVGWVTFDIYPERSDEPPPSTVSQSLESLFGELARDQIRRGLPPERAIPWRQVGLGALGALALLALLSYLVGLSRALRVWLGADEAQGRLSYALALDRLTGAGFGRDFGETREAYAARLAPLAPSLPALTAAHCAWALGDPSQRVARGREARALSAQVRAELAARRRGRWLLGVLNPVAWLWVR